MKKTIIIKTDGNHKIGLGHIYRSINLAEELKKQEQEIIDYIFNKTEHQIKRLSFKT